MAFTHNIDIGWSQGNNAPVNTRLAISADQEVNTAPVVPDSSTDLQVNLAVDVSAMKSLHIVSDQDVTIETNDGSTPDDTLELTADVPILWYEGCGYSNPLTADVTALFITNDSGSSANVQVHILQDSTP